MAHLNKCKNCEKAGTNPKTDTHTNHSTVSVIGRQIAKINGHLTGSRYSFPRLLCMLVHLKFFDSSRPCASLIGTDSRQGLHFSPSCIVRESLHGEKKVVVSCGLVCVYSYSVNGIVFQRINLLRIRILGAYFSLLSPICCTCGHLRDKEL